MFYESFKLCCPSKTTNKNKNTYWITKRIQALRKKNSKILRSCLLSMKTLKIISIFLGKPIKAESLY